MTKKQFYYAFGTFGIALLLMILAMLFTDFKYPVQAQGKLVFAKSYERGVDIDKIVLTNRQEKITLQLKDNLWRVAENSNYYVSTPLLNALLIDINTSVLFSQQDNSAPSEKKMSLQSPDTGTEDSGVLIQTYTQDQLLDSVIIGKTSKNKMYHYAKLENGEIWQVSGQYELPLDSSSWLLQPILELPSSMVEQINFYENGQTTVIKRQEGAPYFVDKNQQTYKAETLLNQLSKFMTMAVKDSQDFPQDALILSRRLEITTFAGLVFYFDFYENKDKSIWIQITLSTTALPMTVVNDYIKDNKFLYEGWFFKLFPHTQKTLVPASLI